jgi:DNA-binding PadR family transcriptional regulator
MDDISARSRLVAARVVRATVLADKSPRARGDEKMLLALDWIYKWGWASPSTLDLLVGTVGRGLGTRLVKRGLLIKTRTQSGGGVKGVPASVLTLSQTGLEEIERIRESLLPYELDPYRIRQHQLRHYQLAQLATARNLLKGNLLKSYLTEKELSARSAAGIKQPDVVWILQSGAKIAVEVELSAKWGRDLEHFIHACIQSLSQAADGSRPRFDMVTISTDSRAIVRRYQAAFQPGSTYSMWKKDAQRRWVVASAAEVPAWVEGRVVCQLLSL